MESFNGDAGSENATNSANFADEKTTVFISTVAEKMAKTNLLMRCMRSKLEKKIWDNYELNGKSFMIT